MKISIISAVAANGVIGLKNQLPWHIPGELQYFKKMTLSKPIIMGRKTFESLKNPLPGRANIVITNHEKFYNKDGFFAVSSLSKAIELSKQKAKLSSKDEVMVIGGALIYQEALPIADRLYLTSIAADIEGDCFFPTINANEWKEVSCHNHFCEKNNFHYAYKILDRSKHS